MKIGDKLICIDNGNGNFKLTIGKEYTVTDWYIGSMCPVEVKDDMGNKTSYKESRFKQIEQMDTVEEQIKLAKLCVGKEVFYGGSTKNITYSMVVLSEKDVEEKSVASYSVLDEIREKGFCVVVANDGFAVPVSRITLAPEYKTFELNNNYTAKIFKDKVEVGCQTFPISVIKEFIKLID